MSKLDRTLFLRMSHTIGTEEAHAMACSCVGRTTADLWLCTAKKGGDNLNKPVVLKNVGGKK